MQAGSIQISLASDKTSATVSVTFPVAFADKPLVIVSINSYVNSFVVVYAINVSQSEFTIVLNRSSSGSAADFKVNWLAMGPE